MQKVSDQDIEILILGSRNPWPNARSAPEKVVSALWKNVTSCSAISMSPSPRPESVTIPPRYNVSFSSSVLLIVRSSFMVWAPSSYGRAAILWFRQKFCPRTSRPPITSTEGLQRPYGQYTVYTYGRWAGRLNTSDESVRNALFNLVQCGNKRQKGVDFAPQLPQHCFWFVYFVSGPEFLLDNVFLSVSFCWNCYRDLLRRKLLSLSATKTIHFNTEPSISCGSLEPGNISLTTSTQCEEMWIGR